MPLPHNFENRLATMADGEVIDILIKPGDYLPEAVALAQTEAARRGLPAETFATAEKHVHQQEIAEEARAREPLSSGLRAFCFFIPMNVWMIFAAVAYNGYGYKRKARDVSVFTLAGFLFYCLLAAALITFAPKSG